MPPPVFFFSTPPSEAEPSNIQPSYITHTHSFSIIRSTSRGALYICGGIHQHDRDTISVVCVHTVREAIGGARGDERVKAAGGFAVLCGSDGVGERTTTLPR